MMQAGKYYVGDLCYVMHDKWDEFCSVTIQGEEVLDGEMALPDGTKFATYGTAYGDGVYKDQLGNSYGVDAGLIGCIRVEDISEEERANLGDGQVIDFPHDFYTSSDDGVIIFGHVAIDTKGEDEDEDYDEDYDD